MPSYEIQTGFPELKNDLLLRAAKGASGTLSCWPTARLAAATDRRPRGLSSRRQDAMLTRPPSLELPSSGEETERAPAWVMRQAGRYLPGPSCAAYLLELSPRASSPDASLSLSPACCSPRLRPSACLPVPLPPPPPACRVYGRPQGALVLRVLPDARPRVRDYAPADPTLLWPARRRHHLVRSLGLPTAPPQFDRDEILTLALPCPIKPAAPALQLRHVRPGPCLLWPVARRPKRTLADGPSRTGPPPSSVSSSRKRSA